MPRLGRSVDIPIIDLFSGAGGLSLGLARAGMVPVASSEMDRDALETYVQAHSKYHSRRALEVFEGDIAAHSFRSLREEVAVVAGGPPCQPYSVGGLRRGVMDVRDGLPQFLRVLEEVRPEAFLMENVPGLAKGTQLSRLSSLLHEMENLGFHVSWKVLHAADFGVAQRRQRLFVVGSRSPGFEWPKPTHGSGTRRKWLSAREILIPENTVGVPNASRSRTQGHPICGRVPGTAISGTEVAARSTQTAWFRHCSLPWAAIRHHGSTAGTSCPRIISA